MVCSFSAAMLQQSQQVPGIKDFFNLVPSLCGCGPESTMEQHHSHYGPSSSPQSHHHSSYPPFHNSQFHQQRHHAPLPVGDYMHHHMHNNNNASNEVKDLSMPPQHSPPPTMSSVEASAKKRDYPSKEASQQQPTRKGRSRDSGVTCNKTSSNNGNANGSSNNSISSNHDSISPIPVTADYNQHLV